MTIQVDSKRVAWLLEELCTELGHCSAARDQARFESLVGRGADAFADAVLAAEGINPEHDKEARRELRSFVGERFARWDAEGAT